jgi:soluble lytic murein transglycosylase-like protein
LTQSPLEANLARLRAANAGAAQVYGIPLQILYSVALTETGSGGTLNPYEMNVDGRAVHSSNLDEALARFALERSRGAKLIDIGCMQINHHWHGSHFRSLAEMFDPEQNVQYAASYLKSLYQDAGSWTVAVARYNAGPGNPQAQRTYVCAVIAHMVASGEGRWTPNARVFCERNGKTGQFGLKCGRAPGKCSGRRSCVRRAVARAATPLRRARTDRE